MQPIKDLKPGDHFIGLSEGVSGHFAVEYWINPDMGGFVEPWETGLFSYATREEAVAEAHIMAEDTGLPLYI
jgi:hypothetical protein